MPGLKCAAAMLYCSLLGSLTDIGFAAEVAGKLMHGGQERSYTLYLPGNLADTRPVPLVVALHSYPSSGARMAQMTGLSAIAERESFLVVYPDGIDGGYNAIMCCGDEDDVGFVKSLVAKIVEDYPVDEKRIYATGISNGGDLAYRLAADLPDLFAAIAPVSGGMSDEWMAKGPEAAVPSSPVSLITFQGKRDTYYDLFRRSAIYWSEQRLCAPANVTLDQPEVTATTAGCKDGSEVLIYTLPQMGHSWPGGEEGGQLSDTGTPIDASEQIWAFFRDHSRP